MKCYQVLLASGLIVLIAVVTLMATGSTLADDPNAMRWRALTRSAERNPQPAVIPPEILAIPTPDVAVALELMSQPIKPALQALRPRPVFSCRPDPTLATYIADRKEALRTLNLAQGPATITFKRPVPQAELAQLQVTYNIMLLNLVYITNTDITGFCGNCNLDAEEARLRLVEGARLKVVGAVSVEVAGTVQDVQRLGEHPNVLLADPALVEEVTPGKNRVKFPEHIYWRYEQACQ